MKRAVYAGSFDPPTLGHLDVIERGAGLFEEVIVCVGINPEKSATFSPEERRAMLAESIAATNVRVETHAGLIVDFLQREGCRVLLKGLRSGADFEYELPMALTNRSLSGEPETVFVVPAPAVSFVSSTLVKQIAAEGGDVRRFVPDCVARRLEERFRAGGPSGG